MATFRHFCHRHINQHRGTRPLAKFRWNLKFDWHRLYFLSHQSDLNEILHTSRKLNETGTVTLLELLITWTIDILTVHAWYRLKRFKLSIFCKAASWASYQIIKTVGCACAGNAGNVFPATNFRGNRQLATPACITARASRTCRDACRDRWPVVTGKTFPAIPAHAQPAILRIWQEAHEQGCGHMLCQWSNPKNEGDFDRQQSTS